MGRLDRRTDRAHAGGKLLRPALAAAIVVLVVTVGPAAAVAASGSGAGLQSGGNDCPDHGTPKDGDVNGDGAGDWKQHEQKHDNGTVQLWCIDRDPSDDQPPHDEYFAVVWVDESGTTHFVGKCPFDEGRNFPMKKVDDGNLTMVSWLSIDRGDDDDGDGKTDDAVYRYSPTNNTVVVMHSENRKILERRNVTPEEAPFDFDDLAPENSSNESFFAAAERPQGEFGDAMTLPGESRNLTVAVRDVTTGEPLGGTNVTVYTTAGSTVETLVTSEPGVARTRLPLDRYVLDVEGAPPRVVDLRAFSVRVAVRASPGDGGDRVARLADRVDRLERRNAVLRDDVDRLRSEVAELRNRTDALRSESEALRTDVGELRTGNAALRTDVAEVERDNDRLRENVSALRSEVAAQCERCAGGGGGGSIPGFGVLVAALALVAAAALAARRSRGRR